MNTATTALSMPSVRGYPVLGHLLAFRHDRLALLLHVSRTCGEIGAFRLGPQTVILANSSELAHAALVEHAADMEKTRDLREFARPLIGNGLLSSLNSVHRVRRPLVAPAFQHRRVSAYGETMSQHAAQFQGGWADGATVDVAAEMMRLTLWIVGKTLFDADVLDEAGELGPAVTTAIRHVNAAISSPLHVPDSWPTPGNRRFQKAVSRLNETIYRIIAERRRAGTDRGDVLSMLLAARDADDGNGLSDAEVRDEVMTLFLAGHETTANALAWTWYLLTQHPDIYARVRAEADQVLAGRRPTVADLPHLPYTLQVLKESMRIFPPAFAIARHVTRTVTLGGYHIPAGAVLIISSYTLHRRPDYFPAPERFDPERFTPEAEARRPRHAYLPFGGGPRICIGNHFAMMEAHLILAALVQCVTFELVPRQRIEPEPMITLRPKYGVKMVVRRRRDHLAEPAA